MTEWLQLGRWRSIPWILIRPRTCTWGTSTWSTESWVGPFYPPGTPPAEFLPVYATHFRTVEIDTTYYRIPTPLLVKDGLNGRLRASSLPPSFRGEITHKKLLADCERETEEFLGVMELLGEKLGPLSLQFPYLNQEAMPSNDAFLERFSSGTCSILISCVPFLLLT